MRLQKFENLELNCSKVLDSRNKKFYINQNKREKKRGEEKSCDQNA